MSGSLPQPCVEAVLLHHHRLGAALAPHVATRLCDAVMHDVVAVSEISATLTPSQRAGLAALPDPLPSVAAVRNAVGDELDALATPTRQLLLAAAVSVDGRVDVALAAVGSSMAEALGSPATDHLDFAAGHLRFRDPRTRIHVHDAASLAERTQMHERLAAAYGSASEHGLATWHRALSTLEGDPTLAPGLLDVASAARRAGNSEWAHAVAREAASHASGPMRRDAAVAAGAAALDAGCIDDAIGWLSEPVSGDDVTAARALPAFVHAVTLREGAVPDTELARHTALLDTAHPDPQSAEPVLRALALAACLHAERGHDSDAAAMLDRHDRLAARVPDAPPPDWARAWCARFATPTDGEQPTPTGRPSGHADVGSTYRELSRALELAIDERLDHALGVLNASATPAPLWDAHRRILIALIVFWAGDITRARAELADAALVAPLGLPFSGLAVALARRLDVCAGGGSRPTTLALEDTHPTPNARRLRTALLVDRAISAYLDSRLIESATLLALVADDATRPSDHTLRLPGLDESAVWAIAGRDREARAAASRLEERVTRLAPAHRRAALARSRIALAAAGDAEMFAREAADSCRSLASPYERARTEMIVGRARAAQGDATAAREHLLSASLLFDIAGAFAWRDACDDESDRLEAGSTTLGHTVPATRFEPVSAASARRTPLTVREIDDAAEELAHACHAAWGDLLTDREQEVALLVVEGRSNREVAEELFVSVRTVEVHLGRVFTKLGIPSRVALAVHAHRLAREYQFAE